MKNLLLGLVFVLGTATSFAGSNLVAEESAEERTCVRVTLSCGQTGWACGETTMEIIQNTLAADDLVCP